MMRGAIIIFLVNYCAFLFSQNLRFSRKFDSPKKNIAVEILNNHPSYFYVLRQNKAVHDITIERRAKPSAEIVAFTPLKLDSVNASWFDYENLDYLVFENNYKVYFFFEKVLNLKKTLYLKIIDTTGRSTGFIELASLEKDNTITGLNFSFKRTANNNILIVASKAMVNGITRKAAILFSTQERKIVWTKRLPLENEVTVLSDNFECNDKNDLFYLQTRYTLLGYSTYYGSVGPYTIPTLTMDSLLFIEWKNLSDAPVSKRLNIGELYDIKSSFIVPEDPGTLISIEGIKSDSSDNKEELIINIKIDNEFENVIYSTTTPYDSVIKEQLTFYDGPNEQFYNKGHELLSNYISGKYLYTLSERLEENYSKEILFRKTDLKNGKVVSQKIIPRKIFFFRNRTRFKNIAAAMQNAFGDSLKILLLENPSNFKKSPGNYNYKDFKKETNPWGSNIVAYSLRPDGTFEKTLVFKNSDFDLVPLNYESSGQRDMVFYLNSGKYEKFAILNLYPF
jgi:hypothetical protein